MLSDRDDCETYLSAVDTENSHSCFRVGRREFDLSVDSSWTKQRRVEDICAGTVSVRTVPQFKGNIPIRFVAMITLIFLVGSNPSNWFNNSNMVLCTSRSPLLSESKRLVPIASSSSMKMIAGAFSLASSNASRTSLAPSPMNICAGTVESVKQDGRLEAKNSLEPAKDRQVSDNKHSSAPHTHGRVMSFRYLKTPISYQLPPAFST